MPGFPARARCGGRRLPHAPRRGRAAGRRARRAPPGAAGRARPATATRSVASSRPRQRASAAQLRRRTRRLRRRAEVPAADDARVPAPRLAADPATRRRCAMVTRTLDAMADGGIYDQLGGGFARYSTDAHWLVPHFEKMLYDNALLAHAYLEGYRATGNERYARVARATLDFMLAELRDRRRRLRLGARRRQRGRGGRFYVWSLDDFMGTLADAGIDERRAPHARRLLGRDRGRQLGGDQRPASAPAPATRRPSCVERGRARPAGGPDRRGRGRHATTSSWPPGTALPCARSLMRPSSSANRATPRPRGASSRSSSGSWSATATACGARPATGARTRRLLRGLRWRRRRPAGGARGARRGRAAAARRARSWTAALRDFWDDDGGTFVDTSCRARPHRRPAARPDRQRDAIGQQPSAPTSSSAWHC